MGDEAELLRHDIRVLRRLITAAHDRAQENGEPGVSESVFTEAYAEVLEERLERLWDLERRGS